MLRLACEARRSEAVRATFPEAWPTSPSPRAHRHSHARTRACTRASGRGAFRSPRWRGRAFCGREPAGGGGGRTAVGRQSSGRAEAAGGGRGFPAPVIEALRPASLVACACTRAAATVALACWPCGTLVPLGIAYICGYIWACMPPPGLSDKGLTAKRRRVQVAGAHLESELRAAKRQCQEACKFECIWCASAPAAKWDAQVMFPKTL